MLSVSEIHQQVANYADQIRNDDPHSLRMMEPGEEWRQGDVRIRRLPDNFLEEYASRVSLQEPSGASLAGGNKNALQLAPGSTVGSQHWLRLSPEVKIYRLNDGNELDGPIVHIPADGLAVVHPEHGDCVDLPAGWYAFPGQRTYAQHLRRVLD